MLMSALAPKRTFLGDAGQQALRTHTYGSFPIMPVIGTNPVEPAPQWMKKNSGISRKCEDHYRPVMVARTLEN